jgi:hypothetical protein
MTAQFRPEACGVRVGQTEMQRQPCAAVVDAKAGHFGDPYDHL